MHGWKGSDGSRNMERTLDVINGLAADIIGLQEVSLSQDQMGSFPKERIAEYTQMRFIEGPTLIKSQNLYGNALLCRAPVLSVQRIDLSIDGREPRGALNVEIDIRGAKCRVITTHLGLKYWERGPQIDQLLKVAKLAVDDLIILMGDLNVWFPRSKPLKRIREVFGNSPSPLSFPSICPLMALDRIWVKPKQSINGIKAHKSGSAKMASDHLPVVADLFL